jgi:phospholipase C
VSAAAVDGRYDMTVQGPNRYWYEAEGLLAGAASGVVVRERYVPGRPAVGLVLSNQGSEAVHLTLRPRAFQATDRRVALAAGESTHVVWPTDHGWYDVEIVAAQDDSFRRRLTGRVETGKSTVTA